MKKTLLNILLAGSLAFGIGDKTKAQDFFDSEFINNDSDDFPEEVIGSLEKEENKRIIYYFDKDNDNFHEKIRVISISDTMTKISHIYIIATEDFFISKSSGFVDYSLKKYGIAGKKRYLKYFKGVLYKDLAKREAYPANCAGNSYKGLTEYDIYHTFGTEFGDRLKKLINGSQSKTKLMEVLKKEMAD